MKRQHPNEKHPQDGELDFDEWHAEISRHWERKAAQLRTRRLRKLKQRSLRGYLSFGRSMS